MDATAGSADKPRAWLHRCEALLVEHADAACIAWAMKTDNIGGGEQCFK
jgi:hypothetical protein